MTSKLVTPTQQRFLCLQTRRLRCCGGDLLLWLLLFDLLVEEERSHAWPCLLQRVDQPRRRSSLQLCLPVVLKRLSWNGNSIYLSKEDESSAFFVHSICRANQKWRSHPETLKRKICECGQTHQTHLQPSHYVVLHILKNIALPLWVTMPIPRPLHQNIHLKKGSGSKQFRPGKYHQGQ